MTTIKKSAEADVVHIMEQCLCRRYSLFRKILLAFLGLYHRMRHWFSRSKAKGRHAVAQYHHDEVSQKARVLLIHLQEKTELLRRLAGARADGFIARYVEPMAAFIESHINIDPRSFEQKIATVELLMLIQHESKIVRKIADRIIDQTKLAIMEDEQLLGTTSRGNDVQTAVWRLFHNKPDMHDLIAVFLWRESIDQERQRYLA